MKAWRFEGGFGLHNLRLKDLPDPVPGPGEVLLTMRAAALNYRDLVVLRGQHGRRVQPPLIPLRMGSVSWTQTGPGVTGLPPEPASAPAFFQHWDGGTPPPIWRPGGWAGRSMACWRRLASFPPHTLVPVPGHLSDAEAATLPCAGLTAWSALMAAPRVRPGEVVLVLGTGRRGADGGATGQKPRRARDRHHILA